MNDSSVNIRVSGGEGIDYLSILNVKMNVLNGPSKKNYEDQYRFLAEQLGKVKLDLILGSEEYKELYEANNHLWIVIDDIRQDKIEMTAKNLDSQNTRRWVAKKKLQEKFFNEPFREVKVFYDK